MCIGSSAAPVLSNIFLACVDKKIEQNIGDLVVKVVRYVDDFLVIVKTFDLQRRVIDVLNVFRECGNGLSFTCELPVRNDLQFLDLTAFFAPGDHLCWQYCPRADKPLLAFSSDHSKIVTSGISVACIQSSLFKTCHHKMQQNFAKQVSRLKEAGYPESVIMRACEKVAKK